MHLARFACLFHMPLPPWIYLQPYQVKILSVACGLAWMSVRPREELLGQGSAWTFSFGIDRFYRQFYFCFTHWQTHFIKNQISNGEKKQTFFTSPVCFPRVGTHTVCHITSKYQIFNWDQTRPGFSSSKSWSSFQDVLNMALPGSPKN